jgi:UDP-N-acetylmuramoyl-L-alanyl-D-glutamate--2,6-diaminopimelate ligase
MNIAESFLLALQLGVTPLKMIEDLKNGIHVPGRLEKFRLNNGAIAFVDYAHTDDALEKVLSTLAEMKKSRLICVFGCGGDRDKSKRSRMGAISAKFADLSIITSDNPRSEDPREIIREILVGIKGKKNTINILDRREAIRTAVEMSKENDIIVIAGKGHEKGQQIGDEIFPFDDREELASFAIGLDHLG